DREAGERRVHLVQAQAHLLGGPDERDPPEHGPGVAALPAGGALGDDQPELLVVAQRGGGHPGAAGEFADGQARFQHGHGSGSYRLTSSRLEVAGLGTWRTRTRIPTRALRPRRRPRRRTLRSRTRPQPPPNGSATSSG